MAGSIAYCTWDECEYCKHYRKDKGGCIPLDNNSIGFYLEGNDIVCDMYEDITTEG